MKRQVNGKFVLSLAAAAVVTGLGIHFLHGAQVKRTSVALLKQSERAEARMETKTAAEYLERYLALRPNDDEALARYGRVLETLGSRDGAGSPQSVKVYEKLLRRDPGRREVRRRLVALLFQRGRYSDARNHLEYLLEAVLRGGKPSREDGELLYQLARCREENAHYEGDRGAAALYRKAIEADPGLIEAYTGFAYLLRTQLRDSREADEIMDAAGVGKGVIAANSASAPAYLTRAYYRKRYGLDPAGAAADVARALELAPDDADVLLAAAEWAGQAKDVRGAIAHLRRGTVKHPKDGRLSRQLATFLLKDGRNGEAVKVLRGAAGAAAEGSSAQFLLEWTLVDVLTQTGATDEALKEFEALKKHPVRPEMLEFLEGQIRMRQSKLTEAARLLERAQAAMASRQETKELAKRALLLLGDCYLRMGDSDRRYSAYNRAAGIEFDPDPYWVQARMGVAGALVGLNEIDKAIEQLRFIVASRPAETAVAGFETARLQLYQNLRRPREERRWGDVEGTLAAVEQVDPGSSRTTVLRAEILAAQDKLNDAQQVLKAAVAKNPDSADLYVVLSRVIERQGKAEEARGVLNDAVRRLGDVVELRVARATLLARTGGPKVAEDLAELERGAERLPRVDRGLLWREMAGIYARLGRAKDAERLWLRLAEDQPGELNAQVVVLNLALRSGDKVVAEKALGRLRDAEGQDGTLWRYGLAQMRITEARAEKSDPKKSAGKLAEARGLLLAISAQRSGWAAVPVALGEVDELEGNAESAIGNYRRAVLELGDRTPEVLRRLVRLLDSRQRYDQAAVLLQKLKAEQTPLSAEMQRFAAQVAFQRHDYDQAIAQAEQSIPDNSDDFRDLIWLGQIRFAAGRPAEKAFRRAVAVAPKSPEARVALVGFLAASNRRTDADAETREAERELPKGPVTDLALGRCFELLSSNDRAAEIYEAVLKDDPKNVAALRALSGLCVRTGRLDDAAKHLERIVAVGAGSDEAALARRNLALIKAAGGQPRGIAEARKLLGLDAGTGAAGEASPEDLRAAARALAVQPNLEHRREAVDLLERRLFPRTTATAADLFLLAQLYEANGDWPGAERYLRRLIEANGQNVGYLSYYIRALLRHRQIDEAETQFAAMRKLAPGEAPSLEIEARLLHARGKGDEAAVLLQKFAGDAPERVRPVANLLEELEQYREAEAMFRKFVSGLKSKRPESVLVLVGFLGRRGRTDEALDLCEEAWKTCRPEAVSTASVSALYSAKADDARLSQRVSRQIEGAIAKQPDKVSLRFDLANVRILEGRYDEAETILRDTFRRDPSNGGPLNNLAWIAAVRGVKGPEALQLVQQAISLSGATPDLLDTRAVVYIAAGKADLAVRDLEDAVVVNESPEKYFHLARAYHLGGRTNEARQALEKARSLGLTSGLIHPLERKTFDELSGELARR